MFETRKEAREYRRENEINGRIQKTSDGLYSINDTKNGNAYYRDKSLDGIGAGVAGRGEDGVIKAPGVFTEAKGTKGFVNEFLHPKNETDPVTVSAVTSGMGDLIDEAAEGTLNTAGKTGKALDVAKSAKNMAKIGTKSLAGISIVSTIVEGKLDDGKLSAGDWTKTGINILILATPAGWVYTAIDLGVGLTTGTTITDRIGSAVDR